MCDVMMLSRDLVSYESNGRVKVTEVHATPVGTVVTLVGNLEVFVSLTHVRIQVQQFVVCR